jgi:hypothetical protein
MKSAHKIGLFLIFTLSVVGCDVANEINRSYGASAPDDRAIAAQQARAAAQQAASVKVTQPGVVVAPDGTVNAPAGTSVEITRETVETDRRPTQRRTESAGASGAGLTTNATEAKVGQENQPSSVQLGSTDATGLGGGPASGTSGGSSTKAEVTGPRMEVIALFVIGALLIALGAWRGQGGNIRAAIWMAGAGLLLIATGTIALKWPEAMLIGIGAGVLVLIVGYLDETRAKAKATEQAVSIDHRAHELETSLISVVRGIAALPEPIRTNALKSISDQTDHADEATVKRTITDIKFKAGVK